MSNWYSVLGSEGDLKATHELLHEMWGVLAVYGRRQGRIFVTKEPVPLKEQKALDLVPEGGYFTSRAR